jgi:O-antigen/teichoic acid export membrane protein
MSGRTPLFRKVMRNAALLIGGRSLNAPLSLAYLALSARALGVREMGVVVLINAFALTISQVVRFESWQAILHFGSKPLAEGRPEDFHRILRFSLVLDALGALGGLAVGLGGAALFSHLLGWPDEARTAGMVYLTIVVFMVSATPTGILRLFGRFGVLAAQSTVSSLVRVVGSGLVLLFGGGVAGILVAWYAGTVAAFILLGVAAWRELSRQGHAQAWRVRGPLTAGFPGLWRFVWATNLNSSLEQIFTQSSTLIVGGIVGPAQAALFRIARQFATALAQPAKLVVAALYPELARLRATGDLKGLWRLAAQVGLAGGAAATLIVALSMLLGRPLLSLIMGAEFGAAAPVLTWLVVAVAIEIWALPLEPTLVSVGRPGAAVRVRICVSILYVAALFPMVRTFGLTGAGAATVGAAVLMLMGMLVSVLVWYRSGDGSDSGSTPGAALSPDTLVSPASVRDGEFGYRS